MHRTRLGLHPARDPRPRRGLDDLIRRRVLDAGALYVGQSAGAIVAGANIRTAFWKGWDDPTAGGDLEDAREWSAERLCSMGLVRDRVFFPHYDGGAAHDELIERNRGACGGSQVVCLSDDGAQAFVSGIEEE